MSRRTRRLLLFGLPAAIGAGLLAAALLWPRTAITRESAARIQKGMALAEVEALLGGPRDETTGPTVPDDEDADGAAGRDAVARAEDRMYRRYIADVVRAYHHALHDTHTLEWHSNQVTAVVVVDAAGRVAVCDCNHMRRADESILDRLRRWLGR